MHPSLPFILSGMMISGTLVTIYSTHWFMAWMGLEISTFAIIPLMTHNRHPRAMEAALKYFVVQSTAAITLLFAMASNAWLLGQWSIQYQTHPLIITLATLALMMKLGLAPLHSWFPEVLQGLNFMTGLILSTWQKFAPLMLLALIANYSVLLCMIVGLLSILIGGWGGLNQTQLRKTLAYSSIAHLGWITLIVPFSFILAFLAFVMYVGLTMPVFFALNYMQTKNINILSISRSKAPFLFSMLPLYLLSLGGLPPFSGFLPKWMILDKLTDYAAKPVAVMAALFTLLSLFFYLRLSYTTALTTPPNNNPVTLSWRFPLLKPALLLALLTPPSMCLIPLLPSFMSLFNS
uniref:NADH-ubiquinone oxidoreductase chain 2 n=2 Tax=Leptolebias minimus TaxID=60314 RepID=Q9TD56_9TELE|nr:NADH dehydrogenase subunit II [Leptolebias minimus]